MGLIEQLEAKRQALTVNELAALLNVSEATIYRQARAGTIPNFKVGNAVRFDPKGVARWLKERV